jgi:hypothetical protein
MSIVKINELDPDIIPPISSKFGDPNYNGGAKIVVVGKPGCFAPGTEIMMYNGTIKKVEDVIIGDKLMGDDSTIRNVLELCNNKEMMYRISPKKGNPYVVNENHILSLKYTGRDNTTEEKILDITVKDFLIKPETFQNKYKWYKNSVNFPEKELPIDSYSLGYWLPDAQITSTNQEVFNNFNDKLAEIFLSNNSPNSKTEDQFLNFLKQYNLTDNKHIPQDYKINSQKNRLQLLAGIIDSVGIYNHLDKEFHILHKNEKFLDDIIYVSRSLGFVAYKKEFTKRCSNSIDHLSLYYYCSISGNIDTIPSQIFRNQSENHTTDKDILTIDFTIEKLEVGEYFGFVLDGNHRFLGADFSVLHNTGKSTLIKALLHAKKHIFPVGMAMSGSEDSNHCYSEIMPSTFVYNEYDEEKIKDFVKRQKIASQHLPNPWAVLILDDCTDDPRIFNKPLQQALYKKGRHWKMFYILSLQYAMDVKPSIRTNVDGIFILREPLLKNREALYKNYASIIPDFTTFCELMDQLTDDYCALYIHNATQTNDWFDCVFYWKAPQIPKGWKFGCPEYWEFHQSRFNEEYRDNLNGF